MLFSGWEIYPIHGFVQMDILLNPLRHLMQMLCEQLARSYMSPINPDGIGAVKAVLQDDAQETHHQWEEAAPRKNSLCT